MWVALARLLDLITTGRVNVSVSQGLQFPDGTPSEIPLRSDITSFWKAFVIRR